MLNDTTLDHQHLPWMITLAHCMNLAQDPCSKMSSSPYLIRLWWVLPLSLKQSILLLHHQQFLGTYACTVLNFTDFIYIYLHTFLNFSFAPLVCFDFFFVLYTYCSTYLWKLICDIIIIVLSYSLFFFKIRNIGSSLVNKELYSECVKVAAVLKKSNPPCYFPTPETDQVPE